MNTVVTVQFADPDAALDRLPERISSQIRGRIEESGLTEWSLDDTLLTEILDLNRDSEERLLRLVRYRTTMDVSDIGRYTAFELDPAPKVDEGIRLVESPISYYEITATCEECGWAQWSQVRDLALRRSPREDFDVTENGELIVSPNLHQLMSRSELSGVCFRRATCRSSACFQLEATMQVPVLPTSPLVEMDHCPACGRPRTRALLDSNGVDLFSLDRKETYVERTPVLHIPDLVSDFAVTDLEFGTVGNRPQGSPPIDARDFPYRSSTPRWIMSSRLFQVLVENQISGFEALRVQVEISSIAER